MKVRGLGTTGLTACFSVGCCYCYDWWDFSLESAKSFSLLVTNQWAVAGEDHARCLGRVNSSLALLLSTGLTAGKSFCDCNCKAEVFKLSVHKHCSLKMQILEFYQQTFYFSGLASVFLMNTLLNFDVKQIFHTLTSV